MESTPLNITKLEPNQIFVFGSNYAGRHGKGAALIAARKFGARNGQGVGLMGQSYGIATKGHRLEVLSLPKIKVQIDKFLRFAALNPQFQFLVTKIGCGLAGYSVNEIACLFKGSAIPSNVVLPQEFKPYI
jgi:hypothetical protein